MALNQHTAFTVHLKNRKELIFYLQDSILTSLHLFLVEDIGVEPMTLCVQGRCSSQLS
jgi:hypothetical protein